MNGKLVFRGGFLACLHYIFHKEGARYLGSNLALENASPKLTNLALTSIASQFECIANRSHRIRKPVMHLSLSPHPDDAYQLDDEEKQSFVQQLLEHIGMGNCQWILVVCYLCGAGSLLSSIYHLFAQLDSFANASNFCLVVWEKNQAI